MNAREWTDRDEAGFQFSFSNRVIVDAFDRRLMELDRARDDAGFMKKYAEFEAFCRAGGEGGVCYWEDDILTNWVFEAAKNRFAAAKDPAPPRDQILAFVFMRGPISMGETCHSFPESFDAVDVVAALKKEGAISEVVIGRPMLYVPGEGMVAKLDALREKQAAHDAELADIQRRHAAGELEEGLSLDFGKIQSDMEDMIVDYAKDHVIGFNEAKARKAVKKAFGDAKEAPKKSFFGRLFRK